jgi:diguanylate cyclase (GGDEF)-like protein/PAS domain S-box-containing protein
MKPWLSIRVLIPALTMAFIALALSTSYFTSRMAAYKRIDEINIGKVHDRLNYIQGVAEQYLQLGLTDNLQNLLASFASEDDLLALLVTDGSGSIIASNRFRDIGLHWSNPELAIRPQQVNIAMSARRAVVDKNPARDTIDGFTQVCPSDSSKIRAGSCGVAFYRVDLKYHYALTRAQLMKQTIQISTLVTIGGVLLIFALSFLVTRPAAKISDALLAFADGERHFRLRPRGNNELTHISRLVNEMFEEVERDEQLLQEKEKRLRSLFNNVTEAIITIDDTGIIESVNPATEVLFGHSSTEMVGRNVKMLMPEPDASSHDEYLSAYRETGIRKIIGVGRETEAMRKDDSTFAIHVSISEFELDGKRYFTGLIQDISERKGLEQRLKRSNAELSRANRELKERAITDGLTGLYNRAHFDHVIEEEMRRASRLALPLSLIMCDIDFFKLYNDKLGHQLGDTCLKIVADTISEVFQRGGELQARYGGEEFVVILPGIDCEETQQRAEALRGELWDKNIQHPASKIADRVTLSIGVATYLPQGVKMGCKVGKLIKSADQALYLAKNNGRNQVVVGDPVIADD